MSSTVGHIDPRQFLWVERYRPQTVDEMILPARLKKTFSDFVAQKDIPNLILAGPPGVGKTTVALAMFKQLGCDYITINGSKDGGIDTLRVDIANFASSVSFSGGRKFVLLDEADYLNANSTQPALRKFMEDFAANCGVVMTCNFKNRIIGPLHSRCSVIDFTLTSAEKTRAAGEFFRRIKAILAAEKVAYDESVVAALISRYFPDWRRTINELQRLSTSGEIGVGALASQDTSVEHLITCLKAKQFNDIRQWVADNSDLDSSTLYQELYNVLPSHLKSNSSIADAILVLADAQYKEAFVANPEINRMAALTTLMIQMDWK